MSDTKEPPRLPDVVDEAGETPKWVPLLGLALLALSVIAVAASQMRHAGETAQDAAAEGEAGGEPAAND